MNAYALVLAGGSGVRCGARIPKQFLPVGGIPIVVRTLGRVLACEAFKEVVVAVHPDWEGRLRTMLAEAHMGESRIVVAEGGASRNDSMRNAVAAIRGRGAADDDVVVVCDAVRPGVSVALLDVCVAGTREAGACVATLPAVDTMLEVEDGVVVSVPPRERLFHGQTPCGARLSLLEHALGRDDLGAKITGTAQLLVLDGATVRAIPGSPDNFKITTPEDLLRAERMLAPGSESKTA